MTRPIRPSRLTVLAWNVFVGHDPADVHAQLTGMIAEHAPDVIVLSEAVRQRGHLDDLGYQVRQLAPKAKRKGNQTEDADIAVLVRRGISIRYAGKIAMRVFWRGPKHGLPHDPRVYRRLRIRKGGQLWRIAGAHVPFGRAAVAETVTRLRKWLRMSLVPSVLIGDMNMRERELTDRVAGPAGAKVAGYKIDLSAYRNCTLISSEPLGKHNSDHNAVLYVFEAATTPATAKES